MHQTVAIQLRIRPDRAMSARVWDRKERYSQAYNAGIAFLIEHEERDAKGYRKPGIRGQGLYKELKHLRQTDPDFAGMASRDLYTGLRDAGQAFELWRRACNDKRRKRIAYTHRLAEYRAEPVHLAGPRKGQPKRPPKAPNHSYKPPEALFRRRKERERGEQYGKRHAYPSAYKPEIRGRHRMALPGLGEVVVQGTVEARVRDLFPGRRVLAWRLLSGFHLVDQTRKITRRTRPEDRRYKLHLQVEVELADPRPVADPVVMGCDPGVIVDLAVAQDRDGPAYAFVAPAGLKRQHGDEADRLRSARATNTKKHSRKYRRLSRELAKTSKRRTRRTVEWERQVACQVVALGQVFGMSGTDFRALARSAKGTKKRPGTNVAATRRRNRALRYARPAALRDAVAARAAKEGKALQTIDPKLSGQRCAACGYTDKSNRKNQPAFICQACGHTDHDDANTARNFAADARTAWEKETGTCPVPRERLGGPSGLLTPASAPVMGRPGGGSRSLSLAVPLPEPRKPPDPRDRAELDPPIRRSPGRPP